MGMQSDAMIKVVPFDTEAANRVKKIDITEYNFVYGWKESYGSLLYSKVVGIGFGTSDFNELMDEIKTALGDKGFAYLVQVCNEDEPEGTTLFYLGDKIKEQRFYGMDYLDFEDEDANRFECEDDLFIPKKSWKLSKKEKEMLALHPLS